MDRYESLPEAWRKIVADAGHQVVIAPRLVDVLPRLKGVTPTGYPDGMTWENADGGFFGKDFTLVIAQESMIDGIYKPVTNERGYGLLFHEFGHALDASLGHALTYDHDIVSAWYKEAAALRAIKFSSEGDRNDQAYFTQSEPFGVRETIAELIARIHGGRTADSLDALDFFKETLKAIQHRLARI